MIVLTFFKLNTYLLVHNKFFNFDGTHFLKIENLTHIMNNKIMFLKIILL